MALVPQVWPAAMLFAAHQPWLILDHTGGDVQEPCHMLAPHHKPGGHRFVSVWSTLAHRQALWPGPPRAKASLWLEPRGEGPQLQGLIMARALSVPLQDTSQGDHGTARRIKARDAQRTCAFLSLALKALTF